MNKLACCMGLAFGVSLIPMMGLAADTPQEQASMVVAGTITIDPHGAVTGYTLQDTAKLPPPVVQLIKETVPAWRFSPVMEKGVAVSASTGMSLRIVADIADAKHATISVAGESFGCAAGDSVEMSPALCPVGEEPSYREAKPPQYPFDAARMGAQGEVFLVLQVAADGHVLREAVRQVNLYVNSPDPAWCRKILANAALDAAKNWTFNAPAIGPGAGKHEWMVSVPINFTLSHHSGSSDPSSSPTNAPKWLVYLPGPVNHIPWVDDVAKDAAANGDAVAGSAPFIADGRFVLLKPTQRTAPGA